MIFYSFKAVVGLLADIDPYSFTLNIDETIKGHASKYVLKEMCPQEKINRLRYYDDVVTGAIITGDLMPNDDAFKSAALYALKSVAPSKIYTVREMLDFKRMDLWSTERAVNYLLYLVTHGAVFAHDVVEEFCVDNNIYCKHFNPRPVTPATPEATPLSTADNVPEAEQEIPRTTVEDIKKQRKPKLENPFEGLKKKINDYKEYSADSRLTDNQQTHFSLYYEYHCIKADIARRMGIKRQSVDGIIKGLVKKVASRHADFMNIVRARSGKQKTV